MAKMNKRGEDDSSIMSTLIAIILAIIVIITIFYFLFDNGSWDFFKNLPGNKYDKKDKVINITDSDPSMLVNYYKVAIIQDGKYVKLCIGGDCNKLRKSNLYWYGDERNGAIYVDKNWALDKKIADVVNNKITISSELLSGGTLYTKVKDLIPSYNDLINLDSSVYISGIIYREKEVFPGDTIFGTKFVKMQEDSNEFGDKLKGIGDSDVLLVNYEYSFGDIKTTQIQLERNNQEVRVFARYKDSDGREQSHLLDCNKNGWVGKTFLASDVKSTLKQTIDDNCKW
ncbi:Uncharacterised protein [uncultured archaeon]|nr:Uncharacterised protein [uncultured archaeon]